jgi:periplasmic glucans biosynthesis protein
MDRRSLIKSALAGLLGAAVAPASRALAEAAEGHAEPFDFERLAAKAEEAARRPYQRPLMELAEPFAELTYDQMRAIRYRPEKLFWGGDGDAWAMDLMPPGFYFDERIRVHLVRGGEAREIPFSTDFFHFHPRYFPYEDGTAPAGLAEDHGFTGVRFRHPLNREGVWDEVAVFQGASYFRSVARDTFYGLSARGLAIGTGEAEPEEFPLFTAYWIEEPEPGAGTLRLWTLLDGPSVAGAYAFTLRPGAETVMDIRLALFPRREIGNAGIAPLTSMYFFGPERRAGWDDFRDAVHDSDGLSIVNGAGETIWRPLTNPVALQYSAFQDENPRRFGLMQRARDFAQYHDAEARYEMRPSAWVEPEGDWGRGSVDLVEIPTRDEFADNIVAYWRPAEPLAAGRRHDFGYRLVWAPDDAPGPLARVVATRGGGSILDERERVFVIDFDLGPVPFEGLSPRLQVSEGEIAGSVGLSTTPDGLARVGFHFLPGTARAAEFRLELVGPEGRASELWLYRWTAHEEA